MHTLLHRCSLLWVRVIVQDALVKIAISHMAEYASKEAELIKLALGDFCEAGRS